MRSRKSKKVYLFDIGGELIDIFNSRKELAEILKIATDSVDQAIFRKSCVQLKYYISNDKDFDVNTIFKKSNFNPLISKQKRHVHQIREYFENQDNSLYEE